MLLIVVRRVSLDLLFICICMMFVLVVFKLSLLVLSQFMVLARAESSLFSIKVGLLADKRMLVSSA